MDGKVAAYIGLAQKANAVVYGEDEIKKAMGIKLVLISSSAPQKYAERLERKIGDRCPVATVDGLDEALHKSGVYAIAVKNDSLAKTMIEILR